MCVLTHIKRLLMEERQIESVRTYEKAWNFDTVIYAVGDRPLLFPINLTQIGFFLVSLALLFVFYQIFPFLKIIPGISNKLVRYGLLPYLLMKFAMKQKVNGKQPHQWMIGELKYWFSQPKKLCRFKKNNVRDTKFKFTKRDLL